MLLVLCMVARLCAQQSDTATFKNEGQSFTILSEIKNEHERQAFTAAYDATDPAKRHALAQAFINAYAQSWLLAQAYDLAARSSIDLAEYQRALNEGRSSLRLLPENPVLLVLIANVEAQNGKFEQARSDASDALIYLDRFIRPANFTEAQWRAVEPQLKASAYFAIGRSLTAQALQPPVSDREMLAHALDALNRSLSWSAKDPETFYVRALVELKLGDDDIAAASDLSFAARNSSELRDLALPKLQQLYNDQPGNSSSFDQFVSRIPDPHVDQKLRNDSSQPQTSVATRAGYAGSAACRGCHQFEYETWRQTGMARMLRPYQKENIIGDFSPGSEFKDDGSVVRMGSDSRPYFEVQDSDGQWQRFHVDYTIGSKWQQAYATRLGDSSFQVFPIEYNVLRKAWVNYWKVIDPPGSPRDNIANFPKLSAVTNYQENCAVCHTSQLRTTADGNDPIQHATFREPGVDCEMCHGPSAFHVAQMRRGHIVAKNVMEPPVEFRRINNREGVRVCAQCHKQTAVRQIGAQQEMNYASVGTSFVPASWSRPYDVFSRRAFYKDGRFRETTFIVEAFTRSACYLKGAAQCASCHSPHLQNVAENPKSLKFANAPDEMCLQCHREYRNRLTQHTHHAADSQASRCVSCHMPKIVNALLFKARSHEIEIPRADLTERFGQQESPNACLLCHDQRDAKWASVQLERWKSTAE
jgi:predicted CXXCH cytochrome family protein